MAVRFLYFDQRGLALTAPLAPNCNDKGTAFGGSLAAIASLAAWATCYMVLREAGETEAEIVVAHSELDYLRPVGTAITALCLRPDPGAEAAFVAAYQNQGRARWTLMVQVPDGGEDAVALRFRGHYAARRP